METAKFKNLSIGDTFDFVDPTMIGYNSFFDRCVKVSARKYQSVDTKLVYQVGTVHVQVFNVDRGNNHG